MMKIQGSPTLFIDFFIAVISNLVNTVVVVVVVVDVVVNTF